MCYPFGWLKYFNIFIPFLVGMTTRGKYMQNYIGNPQNYSHPGKLVASNGKNSRNSYDDDEEEDIFGNVLSN